MARLVSLILLMSSACGPDGALSFRESSGKSDEPSQHIAGQPTTGPWRYQWIDVSEADLQTYRSTILPGRGMLVDADHLHYPLQQRLQTYVDAMDAYVRCINPALSVHTPSPQVRIYDDDDFLNAWASGAPVCVDAPVRFVRGKGHSITTRQYASVMLHHSNPKALEASTPGFWGQPPRPLEPCLDAGIAGQAELDLFIAWMNLKQGPCRYAWRDDAIELFGDRCEVAADFAGAATARYYAVIPQVFLATGFLKLIVNELALDPGEDEAAIVGVVAHELGHFYKSHATNADFTLAAGVDIFEGLGAESFPIGYNYFYTQPLVPEPLKPLPRADSNAIRDQVLRFSPNQSNPLKGVAGALLDPTTGRFILSLVYGQVVSCSGALPLLQDNALYDLGFLKQLSDSQKKAYLQIEALFLDCARKIQVGGGGALSPEQLLTWFPPAMQRQIDATALQAQGSLHDVVLALDSTMRSYSAEEEAFYQLLESERIGYYTSEQEADELAVELLANIGLDSEAHAKLDLQGGHYLEQKEPEWFQRVNRIPGRKPGQPAMDRCEELYRNDWIDPDDSNAGYQFIPLGDLTGIHHGACYRAFNAKRELIAHPEYAQVSAPPLNLNGSWQHFRDLLAPGASLERTQHAAQEEPSASR